jgi:hypothetical protein
MAIAALKEAIILLKQIPSLWISGIVGGVLAAALWIMLNLSGTFFASRLLMISALVLHLFTTGVLVTIRNKEGNVRTMLTGGIRYYFRVLLPLLVIVFGVMLIVAVIMITFSFVGGTSDPGMITALTFGFMIPVVILTFFYDTAAVFEEKKVFASIQRSAQLVMTNINNVTAFFFICAATTIGVVFMLMILWEVSLYDKLEPITRYNETQIQAFTPDQLTALIGSWGMWITTIILFIGVFLLVPLLYSYKACFFRSLSNRAVIGPQPTTGEYDSKGRWYKY